MTSSPVFCVIDDKHIPLFRVMWVSDVPHFCGAEDCTAEGMYEIRLEQEESIFCNRPDRDKMLDAIENWVKGHDSGHDHDEDWE